MVIVTYICENCGLTCQHSLLDEEKSIREYEERSGEKYDSERGAMVCDNCFNKIKEWLEKKGMTEDDMWTDKKIDENKENT